MSNTCVNVQPKNLIKTTVISNCEISKGIFDLIVQLPFEYKETVKNVVAGQFSNIYLNSQSKLLARPISICETLEEENSLRFTYKIAGGGTLELSKVQKGETLRILTNLGNGFNTSIDSKKITIVGGGVGIPPMLELTKKLILENSSLEIEIFLGFRDEVTDVLVNDFKKCSGNNSKVNIHVCTDKKNDGIFNGNVIELIKSLNHKSEIVFSCGPRIMLENVHLWAKEQSIPCFVSMEERMACGFGACVGCAIAIKDGENGFSYKKVCSDGPVFNSEEVIWNDN